MPVVHPPVLVHGTICRVVAPVSSLLEVQEWVGEWWSPSQQLLSTVIAAPFASNRELALRGVPREDRRLKSGLPRELVTEARLIAMVEAPGTSSTASTRQRLDLDLPVTSLPFVERRKSVVRKREYTGSGRFKGAKRSGAGGKSPTTGRKALGLKRRASDRTGGAQS